MTWLRDHGAIANYAYYRALPLGVILDARLLMKADLDLARAQEARAQGSRRHG